MPTWILTCPKCGARREVKAKQVTVDCGKVSCACDCTQCGERIEGQQEYWRWLGLEEGPPTVQDITPRR